MNCYAPSALFSVFAPQHSVKHIFEIKAKKSWWLLKSPPCWASAVPNCSQQWKWACQNSPGKAIFMLPICHDGTEKLLLVPGWFSGPESCRTMSPPQLKSQTSGTASEAVFIIVVPVVVYYYYHHYYYHFLCDCFLFGICGNVPGSHAMTGEKNS